MNIQYKSNKKRATHGFTLVEMLIVAPIVILVIGVFISAIINMTGAVLTSRGANALAYSINDALTRIDQDVKASGGFLAYSFTPQPGQGFEDTPTGQTPFKNTSVANGNMLILNSFATDQNPLTSTRNVINLTGQPFGCSSPYVSQNSKLMTNIVYYVKNINGVNTLWRRVLMPANYSDKPATVCDTPWQKPTCVAGNVSTNCKANDQELVDGITVFNPTYWTGVTQQTAIPIASNPYQLDADRKIALQTAGSVNVAITATKNLSGRTVTQSGSIRSLGIQAPTMLTQPNPTVVAVGNTATFTTAANGTNMTIKWEQSTDSGVTWTTVSGQTSTLTFAASGTQDGNMYHAIYTNSYGQVTSSPARLTVNASGWTPLSFQNSWSDYANGFNTGGYMKTSSGVVILKGLIRRTGTPVQQEDIGILPPGYRPSAPLIFLVSTNSNTAGRIDIYPNGEIRYIVGDLNWLSLENVHFVVDTGRYTSTPINIFYNGWTNYGLGAFGQASYIVDSSNRVNLQGLLSPPAIGRSDGARIFDMPSNLLPSGYMHIPEYGGAAFASIGIDYRPGLSAILDKGLGTAYLTMNAMYYPASVGTWKDLTMQNSWAWYGSIFSTPQCIKAADGLVSVKGLIGGGPATGGTVMAILPVGCRPLSTDATILYAAYSTGAYARVDVNTAGSIIIQTGNSAWLSLDGMTFYGGP